MFSKAAILFVFPAKMYRVTGSLRAKEIGDVCTQATTYYSSCKSLATLGDRSFFVVAPKLWNDLP